jgi:predicted trehalose synthase
MSRSTAAGAQLNVLSRHVAEWRSQHQARESQVSDAAYTLKYTRGREIEKLRTKKAEAERIKRLPAKDVMAMSEGDIQRTFNAQNVKTDQINYELKWKSAQNHPAPFLIHPLIMSFLQQLAAPTILPSLTPELKHYLQTCLGAVKLDVSRSTHDTVWARAAG